MTIKFEKNGKSFKGEVISRGFFNVDQPECYEVEVAGRPYGAILVPVAICQPA